MKTAVRFTLTAGAVALVCACTSEGPQQPISEPLRASFSDGANAGNPDFFFLPPIFKSPTTDPNFEAHAFNADLQPTVEICELAPLVPPATVRECGATIETFVAEVDVANQQYHVNWHTDESGLVLTQEYRIRVVLGTQQLGYADVDPVSNGSQLKNLETGQYIGLVDGRTLPIRFRIEDGAACFGGDCNTKTIELDEGGFVELETTGDRVDIPAQQSDQVVTITLQLCEGIDVDLPLFGNCVRVTADPPLEAALVPPATVSICSIDAPSLPLRHEQSELLTVHRQEGELVEALPHARDFCEEPIGHRGDAPSSLAALGWRAVRDLAAWIFRPGTLHATTALLDVGAGGQSDFFSDFQLALPAKMEYASPVEQTTAPHTAVPIPPRVLVTDADGSPVANARVHFQITSTGGGSITPTMVLSDGDGFAALTEWIVGAAGRHTVLASGRGIADPANNGPAEGFDPFAPAVLHDPEQDEQQPPVELGTGRLEFVANAGQADLIIESLTHDPVRPTDGDLIEYTAVVKNIGTAPAGRFSVQILVNAVGGGNNEATTLSSGPPGTFLNPGETISLRRNRTLQLPVGTYVLIGTADIQGEVTESNEANNGGLDRFPVEHGVIDFETFAGGAPACDNCAATNQFASRGVAFTFAPLSETCGVSHAQLFLSSSAYDEAGGPANHSVTAGAGAAGGFCSGTVSAVFAGTPGTVTFRLRGNDDVEVYPVNAFDATGAPIPAGQIVRSGISTFTSAGGFLFRQETITISSETGIGRVDLVMNGFIVLLDNMLITP